MQKKSIDISLLDGLCIAKIELSVMFQTRETVSVIMDRCHQGSLLRCELCVLQRQDGEVNVFFVGITCFCHNGVTNPSAFLERSFAREHAGSKRIANIKSSEAYLSFSAS